MRRSLTLCCWVACLVLAARSAQGDPPPGFHMIFNGKDLTGWKVQNGKPEVWSADKGVLTVKGSGGGWLMTEKEYGDFELQLQYRM